MKATPAKPVATAATSKSAATKKTAVAKRPPSPRYTAQQQPTSDRYREIQQALADRGYFKGEADGTWGPDSADALRRFQTDQNLDADGKLSSLSLIALGLGPRRDGGASTKPATTTEPADQPAAAPLAPDDLPAAR